MKKCIVNKKKTAIALGISLVFLFYGVACGKISDEKNISPYASQLQTPTKSPISLSDNDPTEEVVVISTNSLQTTVNYPDFSGKLVIEINHNIPDFDEFEPFTGVTDSFEYYSELDNLGRCGTCYAYIGTDLMPTEERQAIGHVRPSGWQTVKYDVIPDRYLFNRCHLIGFQLTGENDNVRNLITGTRYLNIEGMLPYENMVANYIRETNNHVFYRVTPIFAENNLVAKGVQMEAYSMEDSGTGICFNVFLYNIQPGIRLDYLTGESTPDASVQIVNEHAGSVSEYDYIININSEKFHYGECVGVKEMKEENKEYFIGSREDAIDLGYKPCGSCKP